MKSKKYNIAQVGAFDVNSYGDALFPLALKNGLKDKLEIGEICLFSPNAVINGYNKNEVYSYNEFEKMHQKIRFDCIIIGGGELLHFKPILFKNSKGEESYEEGGLWIKPLQWSKAYNIPVFFSGVGVPYLFNEEQKKYIRELSTNVKYVSVRDTYSYQRLEGVFDSEMLKIIPDTIWAMEYFYNSEMLSAECQKLSSRLRIDFNIPYVIVQYGTTYQFEILLEQIELLNECDDLKIIAVPINFSHSDIDIVKKIKRQKGRQIICIDTLLQPIEIAGLIAGAAFFVGTSLHGNLTAMCYDVPCIAVDMYPTIVSKIDGMFDMVGLNENVIPTVETMRNQIIDFLSNGMYPRNWSETKKDLNRKLDKWYDCIAKCIKGEFKFENKTNRDFEDKVYKKNIYKKWNKWKIF